MKSQLMSGIFYIFSSHIWTKKEKKKKNTKSVQAFTIQLQFPYSYRSTASF